MATTQYTVTGMTCGHCVNAVTDEVSSVEGVTDVKVVLEGGSLTVTSDSEIPFDKIAAAVDEAGYTVTAS
jgi:copper chaperone CopZ